MVSATSDHEMDQLDSTGEKLPEKDIVDELDTEDLEHLPDAGYTREEEKAIMKKMDVWVVGLVALLYLLSFLDRSSTKIPSEVWQVLTITIDIGNAKIAGLMEDLKLSDDQYEWLLSAFYITYISFQYMALL